MIIAQRPSRVLGLRTSDIYFPEYFDPVELTSDIGVVLQATKPFHGASPFYTSKIDLRKETDELLAEMNKTTRYEIRRAESRDPLKAQIITDPTLDEISDYADNFDLHSTKNNNSKSFNRNRLHALRGKSGLVLSRVEKEGGGVLAVHTNIADCEGGRTRLLYAVSFYDETKDSKFRALVSRANRLLHWLEMQHFRDIGFEFYDFGGIGGPKATEKQRHIAKFKLGFGGQKFTEYNAVVGGTVLGKTALLARKLIGL